MTPGKEMPPRLLFDNAGRVGSSMQRKGGEGLDLRRGYEAPFLVSCHSKLRQISHLHKKKPFPFRGERREKLSGEKLSLGTVLRE